MDKFNIRRQLLRGSLSAPLVLTVTAAGANVRTTFGACVDRTNSHPPPAERLAAVDTNNFWADTWYRVIIQMTKVTYTSSTNVERYIPSFDKTKYYKLASSNWYTTQPTESVTTLPSTGVTKETKSVAALAFFNEHGTVIGQAWEPNGGDYASKSCYGSVYGH